MVRLDLVGHQGPMRDLVSAAGLDGFKVVSWEYTVKTFATSRESVRVVVFGLPLGADYVLPVPVGNGVVSMGIFRLAVSGIAF